MTKLLRPKQTDRVLEVGTGSGYRRRFCACSQAKCTRSRSNRSLARWPVLIPIDGYQGWAEHAPFNAIIVTAAPDHIPSALIAQLKPGGRMVIPVGRFDQELIVLAKHADGSTTTTAMAPVRFVPLSRE
jgi:protein-L-isoaspartate(D-aspartate) O-methyltransferase